MKLNVFKLSISLALFCSISVQAGDFQWSGVYRIEGYTLSNSELNSDKQNKEFGLHHLVLSPRIEAADGITVRSRFNIFNHNGYQNSQAGAIWGDGVNDGTTSTGADNSNALSQNQAADTLLVSELYVTLVQEFGALIAGRAPVHFGLGMVHNSGHGMFDHWYDNRDLVGYKFVMGNFFFFPMFAKVTEGTNALDADTIRQPNDINDLMFHLQYESPESGTEMGLFYQSRTASATSGTGGNDAPTTIIGDGGTIDGEMSLKTYSLYGLKDNPRTRFGMEVSWQEGDFGVRASNGRSTKASGLGAALEYELRPENSKFKYGVKAGYATGDNPETADNYEGFIFDRNYDVAFMLFNFSVGQANVLQNNIVSNDLDHLNGDRTNDDIDTSAVSNTLYFSPSVTYKWNERWDLQGRFTMAWLESKRFETTTNNFEDIDASLGYELDIGFNFKPNKNIQWVNELGLFSPGDAFKAGSLNFDNSFAWGFVSKAAISF